MLDNEADETTPLKAAAAGSPLAHINDESVVQNNSLDDDGEEPLPMKQILLLCFARLVEPIAFFSIFPFISQMISDTGNLNEADVGFYSGLIESLFSLTQMTLMIAWGRASDRIGRKPVLIFSLAGVSIGMALFGLSKKIWQMIFLRCTAGLFAGTVVTIRTMMSEFSTPRTQARAFSYFAFSGNLGIFLGPLIGGFLADPAKQFPRVFGGIHFFHEYPYALSTFAIGIIGIAVTIICALFLQETLKSKTSGKTIAEPPMSILEILRSPGVSFVLFIYAFTMLLAFAYTAVVPVFYFTSVKLGGFGFTPFYISIFMAMGGGAQAIWLLFVFPPLQHRIGTGGVLRLCLLAWPFFFFLTPFCNFLLRHNFTTFFWILATSNTVLGCGVAMAFTAVQLALNNISPSPATLGTLNGVALTFVSGVRAFAPALFSSIYAQGVRSQILDGYLIWLVMIILAIMALLAMPYFPERAEGRLKPAAKDTDVNHGADGHRDT